jgi:hypothetical protein
MTDKRSTHIEYINALSNVQTFIDKVTTKPTCLHDLRKQYVAYAELCISPVTLFAAVILCPDLFTDNHGSGSLDQNVLDVIKTHQGIWDEMNLFYRDFMGLGINLVDRQED